MTLERVDRLVGDPVPGRWYLVPCVFGAWTSAFVRAPRMGWWPVIGRLHRDVEYFGFDIDHYLGGRRFSGSTGTNSRREAERFEREEKARRRAQRIDPARPLSFAAAASLWWQEAGRHRAGTETTLTALAWLKREIGAATPLSEITDSTVARLVAARREGGVSAATVNRTVTEPLRAILRRAERIWKQNLDMPDWPAHLLAEAQERVRELTAAEEQAYFAAIRPDYAPLMRFALLTGCRMAEILGLRWRDIDWQARRLIVTGKGDRARAIPLTPALEALLKPLPRAHARVFTYESKRADNAPRGARVPVDRWGLTSTHRRTVEKAGIEDFRFHDFRHTAATRLMRASGNIRLVQRLLGHTGIATTMRYAHVTDEDLAAAMHATHSAASPAAPARKRLRKKDSAG